MLYNSIFALIKKKKYFASWNISHKNHENYYLLDTRLYKFPLKYKLQSNHRATFQTHGLIEDINVAISISIQVDLVTRY